MAAMPGAAPEDDGIQSLFDSSPDTEVHTSVSAEGAFLVGLVALAASPFAVMHVVAMGAATVSLILGLVGVAITSRPNVSGRALAPLGLVFAVTTLAVVGVRYLGLDTAFGDQFVPTIDDWLEDLNSRFPLP